MVEYKLYKHLKKDDGISVKVVFLLLFLGCSKAGLDIKQYQNVLFTSPENIDTSADPIPTPTPEPTVVVQDTQIPTLDPTSTLSIEIEANENLGITYSPTKMLNITDNMATDTELIIQITTLPTKGQLYNTNTSNAVAINGTFSLADIKNNYIEYRQNSDEINDNADTLDSFVFSFSDGVNSAVLNNTFNITIKSFCSSRSSETDHRVEGAGSESDPYMLCTAAQLASLAASTGVGHLDMFYKLRSNIDLSSIATPHATIGTNGSVFSGGFDGNNNIISNFEHLVSTKDYLGFFGYVRGAVIKNLTLTDVNLSGRNYVGGLIGYSYFATIKNVSTSGEIEVMSAGANRGGLVGYLQAGQVASCSSTVNVRSLGGGGTSRYAGGLVGQMYAGTVSNSFASGLVHAYDDYNGGLIGSSGLALVTNSYATGAVIGGYQYNGGLIGASSGVVSYSFATGSVTGGSNYNGGLVGTLSNGQIQNSYSTGDVSISSGGGVAGGLVGHVTNNSTVKNSYSSSNVAVLMVSGGSLGGLIGHNQGVVSNSFSVGNMDGATQVGVSRLIGVNSGTSTGNYAWSGSTFSNCGGTCNADPQNTHASLASFYDKSNPPMSNWDFIGDSIDSDIWHEMPGALATLWHEDNSTYIIPFAGSGTESDPYIISNYSDFNLIKSNPRWMGANFLLDDDLDFSGQTISLIGDYLNNEIFYGTIDGGGNYITNINFSNVAIDGVGLVTTFGFGGVIKNLNVSNSSIEGRNYVGTFVGYNRGGNILNSTTNTNIIGTNSGVGGLVGWSTPGFNFTLTHYFSNMIIDSVSSSNVNGSSYVGGLVGWAHYGNIENSSATGEINGSTSIIGGLVGEVQYGNIENSFATGEVNGDGSTGGFAGSVYESVIRSSYSTGIVSGDSSIGGFAGYSRFGQFYNSYTTGQLIGLTSGNTQGGFLGYGDFATISECYSSADVSGGTSVGGFIGSAVDTVIEKSYSTGDVTAVSSLGGFGGGVTDGSVSNSYATGDVCGGSTMGGFVGTSASTISNSYAVGNVSMCEATAFNVGGFLGWNFGIVQNSFATGDVSSGGTGADIRISRFIGRNLGTSTTNYVWSGSAFGGCGGNCNSDTQNTHPDELDFYDSLNSAPINLWNFTTIWEEVAGDYPRLISN